MCCLDLRMRTRHRLRTETHGLLRPLPPALALAQTKLTASGLNPERNFSRYVRGALWDCEFALLGGASYRI